ncbi:hypothetical protein, partial [Sphingobacterium daejeonense]|uniref:hypothetical protein n=1 Tax=Sphingobacterium daejeonense TaxID=371142 RepID=UPI003D31DAB7
MQINGIQMRQIEKNALMEVEMYYISSYKTQSHPYLALIHISRCRRRHHSGGRGGGSIVNKRKRTITKKKN